MFNELFPGVFTRVVHFSDELLKGFGVLTGWRRLRIAKTTVDRKYSGRFILHNFTVVLNTTVCERDVSDLYQLIKYEPQ